MVGRNSRIVLGIDPGLAHTGWGVIRQDGVRLSCMAYGCIVTGTGDPLSARLLKIKRQIEGVIQRYHPEYLGIETVWFGENVSAAFGTGQARGAALVACAEAGLTVGEFTPNAIKMAVVGQGHAEKAQVQYMVAHILDLPQQPEPDHAADALAAAICYVTHERSVSPALAIAEQGSATPSAKYQAAVQRALEKEQAQ